MVEALREQGHDLLWVAEELPGTTDPDVLALAQSQAPPLLTPDSDFGALAFASRLPADAGVVLFRIAAPSPAALAMRIVATIESRTDWAEHFTVVEHGRLRMRLHPAPHQESGEEPVP